MVVGVNLARARGAGRPRRRRSSPGRQHRARPASRCSSSGRPRSSPTSASSTLLPSIVAREDLGIANARMQGAFLLTNQLVGTADRCVPVHRRHGAAVRGERRVLRARCSADLARRDRRRRAASERAERLRDLRRRCVEGIRWLIAHPPMRTLGADDLRVQRHLRRGVGACSSCTPSERLGMDAVGFGLLTTAVADRRDRRDRRPTAASSGGSRWPTSCVSGC